jgi:hypothetical protein
MWHTLTDGILLVCRVARKSIPHFFEGPGEFGFLPNGAWQTTKSIANIPLAGQFHRKGGRERRITRQNWQAFQIPILQYITKEVFDGMRDDVKLSNGKPMWQSVRWNTFDDRTIYRSSYRIGIA